MPSKTQAACVVVQPGWQNLFGCYVSLLGDTGQLTRVTEELSCAPRRICKSTPMVDLLIFLSDASRSFRIHMLVVWQQPSQVKSSDFGSS